MDLIRNIRQCNDVMRSKFPRINNGGCGIAAAQLSKYNNLSTVNWNTRWTILNKNRQARETLRKHLKVVK